MSSPAIPPSYVEPPAQQPRKRGPKARKDVRADLARDKMFSRHFSDYQRGKLAFDPTEEKDAHEFMRKYSATGCQKVGQFITFSDDDDDDDDDDDMNLCCPSDL